MSEVRTDLTQVDVQDIIDRLKAIKAGDHTVKPVSIDELRSAIFHSKDRGKNWDKMDISQLPSLKMYAMTSDPFDSNRLYSGSYSGGVYVMSRK